MRTILLASLLVTTSAMASEVGLKKVSFSVGGRGGLNYSYYNCDSVKDTVEALIEKLGGSSVSVRCTGGLDTWGNMPPMPAYVTATFDNAASGNGPTERVTLKSRFESSCELNTTALNAILPQFENITVVSKRDTCFDNRSRWSYDLDIVR